MRESGRDDKPLPDPPPRFVAELILGLRRLLLRAADALVPPQLALFDRIVGVGSTQLLRAAARLRLPDLLEKGPQTAAELAAATGADPDALHRTLRGLATFGVFTLGRDGRFRNNRLSRVLRTGVPGSLRSYALYFGSPANVHAWADFDRTLLSGRNAFQRVHGESIWEWFDAHPEEGETFAAAMGELTELWAAAVARASPFAAARRLCDVGGGRGTQLAEILLRHPQVKGVLLDGAGVLEAARPYLAGRGVLSRVELEEGSFFDGIPGGCDAYLLKNVLHDWDDARCREILGNCRRAMATGARLLVVETVVEPGSVRGLGPLARLLGDCGFSLRRVLPTAASMSVVESVAV